ncbi:MAG: precorrin-2 C(20)-methyltransferase [Peptococcaceae bacterium]
MLGKLYGVGVGPGDPELLTLKAVKVLNHADVVCFPVSRRDKPSIALEIAAGAVERDWEVLELFLPMTRDNNILEEYWKKAAADVIDKITQGKSCAFITLGDPSFYSTFIYLVRKIKNNLSGVEVEIIPGISAPNILAAMAQVPLVESEERLVIIPGINDLEEIKVALDSFENIMFLKIGRTFPEVLALLKEKGLEKNAVFGARCGFNDGYISFNLDEVTAGKRDYLSALLVKKGGLE